ncbi:hypothetical protein Tco_0329227 [Tanacetum coccineum]
MKCQPLNFKGTKGVVGLSQWLEKIESVFHISGCAIDNQALQASEHRMMTSIEEVKLRVSYQAQVRRQENEDFHTQLHDTQTDSRDIRLEIDVALLARLEILETHMSRIEWQRQRAKDDAVRQMMHIHVLEARAQINTVDDTDSSC